MNIPEASFSEDIFDIAEAMAERDMKDDDVTERIKAKIQGVEYHPDHTERQHRSMARMAFNLLRIENPDSAAKASERMVSFGDSDLKEMANQWGMSFDRAKQIITWFMDRLTSLGVDDSEHIAEGFRKEYSTAHTLAEERHVTVADIFRQDDHYYELQRRTWTPEETATGVAETIDGYTVGFSRLAILLTMEEILSDEEIDMDALLREMVTHELPEEHMKAIHESLEPFFESRRQLFIYDFVKTYGQDAFFALDQKLREKVLPTTDWADELFEA
jgi:hypothetical protein